MNATVKDIIYWALTLVGAGLMITALCIVPSSIKSVCIQLVAVTVGFVLGGWAGMNTRYGNKIMNK